MKKSNACDCRRKIMVGLEYNAELSNNIYIEKEDRDFCSEGEREREREGVSYIQREIARSRREKWYSLKEFHTFAFVLFWKI